MRGGHFIAIEFPGAGPVPDVAAGRRRFVALAATKGRARGGITVTRALVSEVPADINAGDAEALGRWIGAQLRQAKFPRGRAVVALGREHAIVKRFSLPSTEDAELPDMTRLALQRDLPFELDDAVIDFVPVDRDEINTTVLAAAVSKAVVDYARTVVRGAGLSLERVTLRMMGAVEFAAGHAAHGNEAAPSASQSLVIDIVGDTIEFGVIEGKSIRVSRAAPVPPPQDDLAIAEAVVTEARRTWMSCQAGSANQAGARSVNIEEVVLLGARRVATYAAGPLEQMLKLPVRLAESHALVESDGLQDIDQCLPHAGLLVQIASKAATIDFVNPRRAPDLAARTRQRRLLAAGVGIVALLAGWTMARQNLKTLQKQADELLATQSELAPANARYWRDRDKMEHVRRWESSKVDWLQHATYLTAIAASPEIGGPQQLVLDSWTGALEFHGVKYDRVKQSWSADKQVRIEIDGEAQNRETADAFRAALVQSSIYATATPGADAKGGRRMPFGFTYRLRTQSSAPADSSIASAADTAGGAP